MKTYAQSVAMQAWYLLGAILGRVRWSDEVWSYHPMGGPRYDTNGEGGGYVTEGPQDR